MGAMNCPKCRTGALVPTRVQAVEVDQCPQCRGIWFDEQELGHLLAAKPGDLKPLTRGNDAGTDYVTGACPRDGKGLLRVRSARDPQIVVDVCPHCRGIWLDGGEFGRLRQGK